MKYRGLRELNDERGKFSLRMEDILLVGILNTTGMFLLSFLNLELLGLLIGILFFAVLVTLRMRSRPHIIRDSLVTFLQGDKLK